ncbi:MAG: hypothetical protein ABIE43_02845, partial [Patescibacteria group bacterium]
IGFVATFTLFYFCVFVFWHNISINFCFITNIISLNNYFVVIRATKPILFKKIYINIFTKILNFA